MLRRNITRGVLAVALCVAASLLIAAPAEAADTSHGCPGGYVCIYPQDAGFNNDVPQLMYYYYGYYNLSNMYGTHYVLNNQTVENGQEPVVDFCNLYNGQSRGFYLTMPQRGYTVIDLTPINSIKLRLKNMPGCTLV